MPDDSSASFDSSQDKPATKQDIALLMEQMGKLYGHVKDIKEELRTELSKEMRGYMDKKSKETKEYFDFYAGKVHKDLLGATKDDIQILKDMDDNHEHHIIKLEQHAELVSSSS